MRERERTSEHSTCTFTFGFGFGFCCCFLSLIFFVSFWSSSAHPHTYSHIYVHNFFFSTHKQNNFSKYSFTFFLHPKKRIKRKFKAHEYEKNIVSIYLPSSLDWEVSLNVCFHGRVKKNTNANVMIIEIIWNFRSLPLFLSLSISLHCLLQGPNDIGLFFIHLTLLFLSDSQKQ